MERGRYFCPVNKLHHQVVLSVGCNMGDCMNTFLQAAQLLEASGIAIVKKSSLYSTAPWGNTLQNDFLNQVWLAQTGLQPSALLQKLKETEKRLGRTDNRQWKPRPLDIDILFYNDLILADEALKIPHPYLAERKFVLVPLAEIFPEMIHPKTKKTVIQMLDECIDNSVVKRIITHAESD